MIERDGKHGANRTNTTNETYSELIEQIPVNPSRWTRSLPLTRRGACRFAQWSSGPCQVFPISRFVPSRHKNLSRPPMRLKSTPIKVNRTGSKQFFEFSARYWRGCEDRYGLLGKAEARCGEPETGRMPVPLFGRTQSRLFLRWSSREIEHVFCCEMVGSGLL